MSINYETFNKLNKSIFKPNFYYINYQCVKYEISTDTEAEQSYDEILKQLQLKEEILYQEQKFDGQIASVMFDFLDEKGDYTLPFTRKNPLLLGVNFKDFDQLQEIFPEFKNTVSCNVSMPGIEHNLHINTPIVYKFEGYFLEMSPNNIKQHYYINPICIPLLEKSHEDDEVYELEQQLRKLEKRYMDLFKPGGIMEQMAKNRFEKNQQIMTDMGMNVEPENPTDDIEPLI